jgi:hypothetical protein
MEQMDNIEKVYLISFTLLLVGLLFLGTERLERL